MNKEIIYLIIIFFIIIAIYLILNNYLLEKFENNTNFCGRYTWDKIYGESNCKNNSECTWRIQKSHNGENIGWCDSAGENQFDKVIDESS